MKSNYTVPFPAYEAIHRFNRIVGSMQSNLHLSSIGDPAEFLFPRRISVRDIVPPSGADAAVRVTLWFEGGVYAHWTYVAAGDTIGIRGWSATCVRFRWKTSSVAETYFPGGAWFEVSFDQSQIGALLNAANGAYYWGTPVPEEVLEVLCKKAEPIRLSEERQRVANATWDAEEAGLAGSWIDDHRSFRPDHSIVPPETVGEIAFPPEVVIYEDK